MAECITEEEVQSLNEDITKMYLAMERKDWEAYYSYHRDFHNDCFNCCNIPYLVRAVQDAWDHHERGIKLFKLTPWSENPDISEHECLLAALAAHNVEEAANLLTKNRKRAFELYREKIHEYIVNRKGEIAGTNAD